ncbi:MAG: hypothetical protein AAFX05_06760 [Planctomycetota bacterium]
MTMYALRSLSPLLFAVILALGGCASSGSTTGEDGGPPLSVALEKDADPGKRVKALRRAEAEIRSGEIDAASVRELLKSVAWSRSNPPQVRTAAISAIHADEAQLEDTRTMLRLMLPTEAAWRQWKVIEYIGDIAADEGWTDLAPGFVVSWSRYFKGMPDRQRPEYDAIVKLFPEQPAEEIVFDVFVGRFDLIELRERERLAAWSLLRRLDPDNVHAGHLLLRTSASERDGDEILETLYAAARDLRAIPETGEQLEWVRTMRAGENRAFWEQCREHVQSLSTSQIEGFALRHASGVRWAAMHEPSWLGMDRQQLLDVLEGKLDGRKHAFRGAASGGQGERFRHAKDDLSWGDTLLALIAVRAVDDPDIIAALFVQADEDNVDVSTEYGGVLDAAPDGATGFVATLYPPRPAQRVSDRRFIASQDMIDAGACALFHYHFHATDHNNDRFAGPSDGDIEYARLRGRASIVFTFLDRERLNADYYQPSGTRLDLGILRRP